MFSVTWILYFHLSKNVESKTKQNVVLSGQKESLEPIWIREYVLRARWRMRMWSGARIYPERSAGIELQTIIPQTRARSLAKTDGAFLFLVPFACCAENGSNLPAIRSPITFVGRTHTHTSHQVRTHTYNTFVRRQLRANARKRRHTYNSLLFLCLLIHRTVLTFTRCTSLPLCCYENRWNVDVSIFL